MHGGLLWHKPSCPPEVGAHDTVGFTDLKKETSKRMSGHEKRFQGVQGSRIQPLDLVELLKRFLLRNRMKALETKALESWNP
jgi:hypothetical protein